MMLSDFVAKKVVHLIESTQLPVSTETAAHEAIYDLLVKNGIPCQSEFVLDSGSRIDLLVGEDVGVEIKTGHDKRAIAEQLQRYAQCDQIGHLILATGRSWPKRFQSRISKPFYVANMSVGWL